MSKEFPDNPLEFDEIIESNFNPEFQVNTSDFGEFSGIKVRGQRDLGFEPGGFRVVDPLETVSLSAELSPEEQQQFLKELTSRIRSVLDEEDGTTDSPAKDDLFTLLRNWRRYINFHKDHSREYPDVADMQIEDGVIQIIE